MKVHDNFPLNSALNRGTFQTKRKTHILCPIKFFSENRDIYEIMWKNMVQPDRSQMTV